MRTSTIGVAKVRQYLGHIWRISPLLLGEPAGVRAVLSKAQKFRSLFASRHSSPHPNPNTVEIGASHSLLLS